MVFKTISGESFRATKLCWLLHIPLILIMLISGGTGPEKLDRMPITIETTLMVILAAPLIEELLFRGPLRLCLIFYKQNALPTYMIWLLSSLLFGFVHIYNFDNSYSATALIYGFTKILCGLVFGWCVIKNRSLFCSILAHFMVNLPFAVLSLVYAMFSIKL